MELLERIPIPTPVLQWGAFVALLLGLGSLVIMPLLVIAMPHDYFMRPSPVPAWGQRHPVPYFLWRLGHNTLGAILVLLGIAMLVLPGQGILTILVGLVLLEFPGKRKLELRIVCRPRILKALNWIRRKADRELLVLPPRERKRKRRLRDARDTQT